MKNLSLVLNIVLLVAVIVLYVLYFSNRSSLSTSRSNDTSAVDLKIAFINSDTVVKYYDYLKAQQDKLESKSKKLDQEYRNRAMGLQNEIAAYQRNVSSMTLGQVRATEEDLGKKQQNLQMYQQSLQQQMMEEEQKLQKELYERVSVFLKQYGEQKGLQAVFKYDPSSDMMYGGSALDITNEVVAGLNEAYRSENNPSAVKSDSTKTK
jgi:outer membrane protein